MVQFKNYQIPESKNNLAHVITSLDTLTKTIKEKNQNANSLLPNISSLRAEVNRKLSEYNFMTYQLILNLYKNKTYNPKMDLASYVKSFLLSTPFVSFNDFYDPSNDPKTIIKNKMLELYERSQRSFFRGILLYGPKGSGKTLAVHAFAQHIGAVVAHIEGEANLKIKFFVTELGRICSEFTKRPVVIFIKNADFIVNKALPELLFLYDKFNNNKKNIMFILSSTIPPQNFPRQLKFTYIQCINCVNQRNKYGLFKFLTNKFGINISMNEQDLMNFVYQNFRIYSNNDVFQVIKTCLDLKKQEGGSLDEVDRTILEKAMRIVPGSLSPQIVQYYNL
jgi:Cdc6-like AAA superfamily ATPase